MKHWFYKEQLINGEWVTVERKRCSCYINETHWTERPEPGKQAA